MITKRFSGVSGANTLQTVSASASSQRMKLLYATAVYSAAPTQAGVTTTVNSSLGAGYDAILNTGTANAQTTVYIPTGNVVIEIGDAFDITAPAGGAGITSSIAVYVELL